VARRGAEPAQQRPPQPARCGGVEGWGEDLHALTTIGVAIAIVIAIESLPVTADLPMHKPSDCDYDCDCDSDSFRFVCRSASGTLRQRCRRTTSPSAATPSG